MRHKSGDVEPTQASSEERAPAAEAWEAAFSTEDMSGTVVAGRALWSNGKL